jgi:hypothetical protein
MQVLNPLAPLFRPRNNTPPPNPLPHLPTTHLPPATFQPHLSHRQNFPVGDVLHDKPDNALQIYVQNVNGIKLDKDKVLFKSMLRHMHNINADYFGFAEMKLETRHHHLYQQLQHSLSRTFQHQRSAFATSPIKFDTNSKPGGVSCTVVNDLVGHVTDISKDILGRWTTTKLTGKDGKIINIITAYQCVPHPLGRGHTRTVNAQQWAALRALDRPMDPRKAFIADLKSHVRALHTKHKIIKS